MKLSDQITRKTVPNLWDVAAFLIVMSLVAVFGWGSHQMAAPYTPGEHIPLSLDPLYLP